MFYSFATRWMVSEVALNRARINGNTSFKRKLKLWTNTKIGRIGMALTKHQHEDQGTPVQSVVRTPNVEMIG